MKELVIQWDSLRNGDFPSEVLDKCGLSVYKSQLDVFKQIVTVSADNGEDITPELAFHMGCLIASNVMLEISRV